MLFHDSITGPLKSLEANQLPISLVNTLSEYSVSCRTQIQAGFIQQTFIGFSACILPFLKSMPGWEIKREKLDVKR